MTDKIPKLSEAGGLKKNSINYKSKENRIKTQLLLVKMTMIE